ncbi:MAG: hypothetical protein ABR598_02055 [Candidatus Dormibacteria bacterium]
MRNVGVGTRMRAWLLRTFRGRPHDAAAWADQAPVSAGPAEAFGVAGLYVAVTPVGLRSAGQNPVSIVYEVQISREGRSEQWSSRYGFPPAHASARRAADAALDELCEISQGPAAWMANVTAGMSEDEVEAMEDNPALQRDLRAADWVGPELEPLRAKRAVEGTWLAPPDAAQPLL